MRCILFSLLFFCAVYAEEPACAFTAPKGWEAIEPNALNEQVKLAYIKKEAKEGFFPSLNLVVENVTGNLTDYLNNVKKIHEQNRNNRWRKLGKVHTAAGEAQLTEVDTHSAFGPVRLLQLFLLKEGRVYIVTEAALKKDIPHLYTDFQKSFHSLTVN